MSAPVKLERIVSADQGLSRKKDTSFMSSQIPENSTPTCDQPRSASVRSSWMFGTKQGTPVRDGRRVPVAQHAAQVATGRRHLTDVFGSIVGLHPHVPVENR